MRRMGRARYALITLLCAAIAAGATAFLLRGGSHGETEQLAEVMRQLPFRPIEGRLVGAPFAPRRRVTRGADGSDPRLEAASTLFASPKTRPAAYLILGDTQRAVDTLQATVAAAPADPHAWSDYAAARIEHGIHRSDAESFALALAAADNALQLDSSFAEAAFNRALALEHLGIRASASEAYEHYMRLDRESEWNREAAERRRQLQIPTAGATWSAALAAFKNGGALDPFLAVAARHPQQARMWAEGECLVLWSDAFLGGRASEAERWLSASRAIGAQLASNGEPFVADLVAAIDRASAAARNDIARGHAAYGRGRATYGQRRVAEAAPHFDEAVARFTTSPMRLMATYFRANVAFDQNDIGRALALLDEADQAAHDRYIAFRAQTRWQRGTIYGRTGRTYESLAAYHGAAEDFTARGERENAARMQLYAATLLSYLGRASDAWTARVAAHREASLAGNPELFETAFNTAARAELREKRWDLARSLFNLQLEPPNTNPRLHFDALLWRAYAAMHCTPAAAMPNFDALRAAANAVPDAALRRDAQTDAHEAEAYAIAQRNPARALALLEEALAYREQNRQLTHIARAHTEIARLQRTQGRDDGALEHLQHAIDAREQQGAAVARDDLRDAFLHSDTTPYEMAVEILIERGRFAEAFDAAERMRARLLVDRLRHARAARPMSAAEVQRQMSQDTTILQIVTTPSATSLLIADREEIRGLTIRRTLHPAGTPRALYDLLIAPVLRHRPNTKTLVIVAADPIAFAGLRAPDGRYLVELATIVVPPSATTFLLARNTPAGAQSGRSVFIADPAFDTSLFPRLERIAGARQEAQDLTRLYPGALVLTDTAATEAAVRDALPAAPMIHLATHALTHRDDPRHTVLPLAADREGGLLYLPEIAALELRARPLVFLNGCQTGASANGPGSVRSLASAFLLAGARSVVATLWDIDDAHARKLSVAFHERLTRGEPIASALRSAQLQMLRSPDPSLRDPRFWSAFQTLGADQ